MKRWGFRGTWRRDEFFRKKKLSLLINGFLIEKKLQKLNNFVLASVGFLRTPFFMPKDQFRW